MIFTTLRDRIDLLPNLFHSQFPTPGLTLTCRRIDVLRPLDLLAPLLRLTCPVLEDFFPLLPHPWLDVTLQSDSLNMLYISPRSFKYPIDKLAHIADMRSIPGFLPILV